MRVYAPRPAPTMGFLPLVVAFATSGAAGAAATAAVVTATGTLDAVGSGVKAVVNSPVGAPFRWLIEGPLKDFARSTFGKWTLNVIANVAFGPVYNALGGTAVGPFSMLATAVYAVPGVLAGGGFYESWVKGTVDRLAQVLEYFGARGLPGDLGAKAGEAFSKGLETATRALNAPGVAGFIPAQITSAAAVELARRFNVRPDAMAYALAAKLRSTEWKAVGDAMKLDTGEPAPREVTVAPIKPTLAQQLNAVGAKLAASPGLSVLSLETSIGRKLAFQKAGAQLAAAGTPKVVERLLERAPVKGASASSSSSKVPLLVGGAVVLAAGAAAVFLTTGKRKRR